ncbi:MAG: DNA-3-methyladenine glycosylase [Chloroflexota bacterium]
MASIDTAAQATEAIEYLSGDSVMSGLIEQWGPLYLTQTDDYFFTLVDAITSQQLSSKAAATIVGRIRALVPEKQKIEAEDMLEVPDQALRDAGLSWGKVSYVKDLSARVASGEIHLGRISEMEDEEIIKELVAVKGIGRWTAEMFLIFSLARPDVFAVDDYGLRAALKRINNLPDLPRPAPMRQMGEPWRPFRSYASLYLWRSVGGTVGQGEGVSA